MSVIILFQDHGNLNGKKNLITFLKLLLKPIMSFIILCGKRFLIPSPCKERSCFSAMINENKE